MLYKIVAMLALSKGAQAFNFSWIYSWFGPSTEPKQSHDDQGNLKLKIQKSQSQELVADLEKRDIVKTYFRLYMKKWCGWDFGRLHWDNRDGKNHFTIHTRKYINKRRTRANWEPATNHFQISRASFRRKDNKLCVRMEANDVSKDFWCSTKDRYIAIRRFGSGKALGNKRFKFTVKKIKHECGCGFGKKNGLKASFRHYDYDLHRCHMCKSSYHDMFSCRTWEYQRKSTDKGCGYNLCERCFGDGYAYYESLRFLRRLKTLGIPIAENEFELEGEGDTVTRMLEAKHGDSLIFKKL